MSTDKDLLMTKYAHFDVQLLQDIPCLHKLLLDPSLNPSLQLVLSS